MKLRSGNEKMNLSTTGKPSKATYPDSNDESEGEVDHEVTADDQEEIIVPARPQRNRNPPARLTDCEVTSDNAVNDEGDFIHFALLADVEPVNYKEALKTDVWKTTMIEELQSIERSKPGS